MGSLLTGSLQYKELKQDLERNNLYMEAHRLEMVNSVDEFITIMQGQKKAAEKALELSVNNRLKFNPEI